MQHQWIQITQQRVDVIVDPITDEVFVFPGEDSPGEALGCSRCGAPLTQEYFGLPCVEVDAPAPAP